MIPRALTPAAFSRQGAAARIDHFTGQAMGTDWSLHVVSPPTDVADGLRAAFDLVVSQMSQWDTDSDISRFNRSAPGAWQSVPDAFARVVKAALEIARASDGAFDPCLGRLSDLWGFGAAGAVDAVPDGAAVERAANPAAGLDYDPATMRVRRPAGRMLDLSGIAKGFGVDLAAEWLLRQGARHFLLEIGGELRGEGICPDGQPWWVDVEMPAGCEREPFRIALHDQSVATSGDYRRGFEVDGRRYSHSLDPRTGWPVVNGVRSATVVHRNCMMADGWATALTILGPRKGMALADEQGFAACIVTDKEDHMSREWQAMLS